MFISSNIGFKDVLTYIEFEDPDYFDAFSVPEADELGMTRVGKDGKAVDAEELICRWARGFDAGQFKDELNVREAPAIWNMLLDARRIVMERWKSEIRKLSLEEICTLGRNYNECQDQLTRKFWEARAETLTEKRIIGCTTTGAAMFAQDIRAANPDVLLVEEAGEILESHILTAMSENTSQMILIGDHKQLRPKVNNYKLTVEKGDGFELNRSLFERLVLRGFPHETLTAQHRMRPEISAFIRKLTYPNLTDATKTQGRADIRGIQNNIIFIDHTHPEDNDFRISDTSDEASSGSKQNTYEVEMVWKIVRYLAQQGYGTEKLVVLTPYLGQLSKLRDVLKTDNDPMLNDLDSHDLIRAGLLSQADNKPKKRIRLATIDNYQGEESDIVIASLTRSNEYNDIGFMNSAERLNVLISRARDGLILIGNSQTFINARRGKELWGKFFELVKQGDYMYKGFPIKCERHPYRMVLIKSASEFDDLCSDGGCTEICDVMLNCGIHPCPLKCHQISDHSQMPCQHPYSGVCPAKHKLKWKCHQPMPDPCPVCVKEAGRAEEKRKRELELKQKLEEEERERQIQREEEQLKHNLCMTELDAKLKAEMEAISDAKVAQQRANVLKQKMKDFVAARANAQAHTDAVLSASPCKTTNPVPPAPPSNPQSSIPPANPTPPSPSNPPPKMKPSTTLLSVNPGLASRFSEEIILTKMAAAKCLQVLDKDLQKTQIILSEPADTYSSAYSEMDTIVDRITLWNSRRSNQLRDYSQQVSPASSNSHSLPPFSSSPSQAASPMFSKGSFPPTPDRRGQARQLPTQGTPQPQSTNDVQRDPAITDAVWRQLEVDKAAAQEAKKKAMEAAKMRVARWSRAAQWQQDAEAAARALAAQKAQDQAEQEELWRQQEAARLRESVAKAERERVTAALFLMRREQERIQQKSRTLGVCVQGYQWIKQPSGYRCVDGSHFIHDSQLQ